MNGFNQSFTVYGFTLSFWDIWLWSIIGAIVATALYANPTIFVVNVFFSNILLSFTPIPAIYDPFLIHFIVLSRSLSFYL